MSEFLCDYMQGSHTPAWAMTHFPAPNNKINKPCLCKEGRQISGEAKNESEGRVNEEGKDHVPNVTQPLVCWRKSLAHSPLYLFKSLFFSSRFLNSLLTSFRLICSLLLHISLLLHSSQAHFHHGALLSRLAWLWACWIYNLPPPASQCPHCQSQWEMEAAARHWHDKFLLSSHPVNQTPTVAPLKTSLTFQRLSWWLVKTVILLASKLFN